MKLTNEEESRSLHSATGARIREGKKKPAAPVGMTGLYLGAQEKR